MGDDNRTEILFDRLMLIELRGIMSKLDPKAYAELRSYHEPPKVSRIRTAQCQYTTNLPRLVHHEPPKVSTPRAAKVQWSVQQHLKLVKTTQGQYTSRFYHLNKPKFLYILVL